MFSVFPLTSFSQNELEAVRTNKIIVPANDTINVPDSILNQTIDSTFTKKKTSKSPIETKVIYSATDSIVLSRDSKMVYLYNKAKVEYGEITLEADYIEYDQENNIVYAHGVEDSLGNLIGKPVFTEKGSKYEAKTIRYNFKTKKGYIEEVFTEEEDGFLHSQYTKKLADNSFLMKNGKYTTCDEPDHPHFYLSMSKAKVIPGEKIISGYSYLVLQDLPLKFLFVPFGYFPSQKEQSSGIIVPRYGEQRNRGFYLQDGGYYFGISDRMDLAITADIFSEGSWGTELRYRFVKKYKFNSNFNFSYNEFIKSEKGLPDYLKSKDYKINWVHTQDAKANPSSKFSANVNYSTTSYEQYNSKTIDDLNTNTKSSSISYSKSWIGNTPFRLTAQLNHSQNSQSNNVTLALPVLTFNMDRKYPFRKEKSSGEQKWYENIEISYKSKLENRITTADSLLFNGTTISDFDNGFQHNIPISTNIKILKYFNLSPQVEYTGILYPNYVKKSWNADYYNERTKKYGIEEVDTVPTIKYAQMVTPSISLNIGPNIYGMYRFRNPDAKIEAIRHVITPSVGVSYRPDLGSMVDNYYDSYTYRDSILGERNIEYSIFSNGIYKLPAAPGQSGTVSLGLNNNLEMKVRSDKDTVTGTRKIKLIEGLRISTAYNIFADSLNWSTISISGRTTLFKDKVNINMSASVDPYAIDNVTGRTYNEFHWNVSDGNFFNRIGRLESFNVAVDFNLNSKGNEKDQSQNKGKNLGENLADEKEQDLSYQQYHQTVVGYVDFDIPWNVSVGYNYNYSKPGINEGKTTQTARLSGDFSLTPKWKISFRTNYDITNKELSSTSLSIHRDLHCWEMSFTWIPIGRMQSYNFQINVKASTLKDFLKLPKKRTWQENL